MPFFFHSREGCQAIDLFFVFLPFLSFFWPTFPPFGAFHSNSDDLLFFSLDKLSTSLVRNEASFRETRERFRKRERRVKKKNPALFEEFPYFASEE